jgi:hypothetical protein
MTVEQINLEIPEQSYLIIQVRWYAYFDACPVCKDLNGQVWETPRLTGTLIHPVHGPVYDLDADVSLTHPNCRCFLEFNPIVNLEQTPIFQSAQNILAEAKQGMPSNIEDATRKIETLRVETAHATGELRELEYLFYRTTSIFRRMGLPEDVNRALGLLQRMILVARMVHTTMIFLEMSTPYGWTLAMITTVAMALEPSPTTS